MSDLKCHWVDGIHASSCADHHFENGRCTRCSEPKRTTKVLTGTFRAVYHGSYLAADEVADDLSSHLDSGLNDRDDLRTWEFTVDTVHEIDGDPEGYDA